MFYQMVTYYTGLHKNALLVLHYVNELPGDILRLVVIEEDDCTDIQTVLLFTDKIETRSFVTASIHHI